MRARCVMLYRKGLALGQRSLCAPVRLCEREVLYAEYEFFERKYALCFNENNCPTLVNNSEPHATVGEGGTVIQGSSQETQLYQ